MCDEGVVLCSLAEQYELTVDKSKLTPMSASWYGVVLHMHTPVTAGHMTPSICLISTEA